MKAALWYGRRDIRVEDVARPLPPPPGQVTIRVACCGICGTDLHEYVAGPIKIPAETPHPRTGIQAPVILGHELAGEIVEIGPGVTRVRVGDRVALQSLIGCQECEWCKAGLMGLCPNLAFLGKSWSGGGFSSFVNVYDYMCYKLPDQVPDEIGALLEPFAAAVRAIKVGEIADGDRVAILGAGPLGLMAMQAAQIAGAESITVFEISNKRLKLAQELGASEVVNPIRQDAWAAANSLTHGEGFDKVFECVGSSETGLLAGRIARRKGRVVIVGVFAQPALLDFNDIVYGEKTLIGTMGGYGAFDDAIEMMASGKFRGESLITRRIPLEEIVLNGFEHLIENREEQIKILVIPE